jgi:predicted O-methyltransferase YrrM
MLHFYESIHGWFDYQDLYSFAVKTFNEGLFVEVGSWLGRSASHLAVEIINSGKPISLHCVDTWLGSEEHYQTEEVVRTGQLYNQFLKNIEPVKNIITPVKKTSLEASLDYKDGSLDFVFLDAAHDYHSITEDIKAWYPKVKSGGIFSGHDYQPHWPGVVAAVDEFCTANHYTVEKRGGVSWMFFKR